MNNKLLDALMVEASKDCRCTPEQQTGDDPTVCRRCRAAEALNTIGEVIESEYKQVFKEEQDIDGS